MSSKKHWCAICRGDKELFKCPGCVRRFHIECLGLQAKPPKTWRCDDCNNPVELGEEETERKTAFQADQKRLAEVCRKQTPRKRTLLQQLQPLLAPFLEPKKLAQIEKDGEAARASKVLLSEVAGPACESTQPSYTSATLRDYQVDGVNWLAAGFENGVGGILADQMGLGKTLQTLSFLAYLKDKKGLCGPSLVVAPLAVYQNWANECKQFTPTLSYFKLHGSAAERSQLLRRMDVVYGEYDVYVTTYDTLKTCEHFFTEDIPRWSCLVIDEAHHLKNEAGALHRALSRITANYRLLLTGTPLQNNLHELWAMLNFLLPEVFTSSDGFDSAVDHANQAVDAQKLLNARRLLSHVMLRRTKEVVGLPPKREAVVACPMAPLQARWYNRLLAGKKASHAILSVSQLKTLIMQLRKVCNHPRTLLHADGKNLDKHSRSAVEKSAGDDDGASAAAVRAELVDLAGESLVRTSGKLLVLDSLMAELIGRGSRFLIFSTFTQTLNVLQLFLELRGIRYSRMDGATNPIQRELDVRDFNAPNSPTSAYLISTRAGGVGINLATADAVVLFDSDWNPQVDLQAIDRAHRIGQRKPVRIFRLLCARSVEERIRGCALSKMVLDTAVVGEGVDGLAGGGNGSATGEGGSGGNGSSGNGSNGNGIMELDEGGEEESAAAGGAGAPSDALASGEKAPIEGPMSLKHEDLLQLLDAGRGPGGKRRGEKALGEKQLRRTVSTLVLSALKSTNVDFEGSCEIDSLQYTQGADAGAEAEEEQDAAMEDDEEDEEEEEDDDEAEEEKAEEGEFAPAAESAVKMEEEEDAGSLSPSKAARKQNKRKRGSAADGEEAGDDAAGEEGDGAAEAQMAKLVAKAAANAVARAVATTADGDAGAAGEAEPMVASRGGRQMPARRREQAKYFSQDRSVHGLGLKKGKGKPTLVHEDFCFLCEGGGELLCCGQCPKVYHAKCVGLKSVPTGAWNCPWHACEECGRTSSTAGGVLFRCTSCPTALCYDCSPPGMVRVDPSDDFLANMCARGWDLTKQKTQRAFFVCKDCADEQESARRKVAEEARLLSEKAMEKERRRREIEERKAAEERARQERAAKAAQKAKDAEHAQHVAETRRKAEAVVAESHAARRKVMATQQEATAKQRESHRRELGELEQAMAELHKAMAAARQRQSNEQATLNHSHTTEL